MRRISISNIAWEADVEEEMACLLMKRRIDAIDIAPTRYFSDPSRATRAEVQVLREWWARWGIDVLGLQALLFGTAGLNLFGDEVSRRRMIDHLVAVARIGVWLGANRCVFGSPRNRDRTGLDDASSRHIAIEFLSELGARFRDEGAILCLEPNPPAYGCNFLTSTDEAAEIVRQVGMESVRLHIDAGTLAIVGEAPGLMIDRHASLVGYVHVSEPNLAPIVQGPVHAELGTALESRLPLMPVSIEMRSAPIPSVLHAIDVTRRNYAVGT